MRRLRLDHSPLRVLLQVPELRSNDRLQLTHHVKRRRLDMATPFLCVLPHRTSAEENVDLGVLVTAAPREVEVPAAYGRYSRAGRVDLAGRGVRGPAERDRWPA